MAPSAWPDAPGDVSRVRHIFEDAIATYRWCALIVVAVVAMLVAGDA